MGDALKIALVTVSDTRTAENDTSGDYLADALSGVGHELVDRVIVIDDCYLLRARVSSYIADPMVQVVLMTGGTGFTGRDSTPEAIGPLLDTRIDGFGELFRQLSFAEIGTSTVQSRALGGLANNTLIFCVPGSTGACKTAWDGILLSQLDSTHRPCNFAELILRGHH
ncbi:molybdenum cofactor biosynthesis protein B [Pseudomonadales bacterium]|jgi:molybdenum cofactor biosynthesis protein B|nr:molybdenum cofactor biosynthesis protein B [Gammaproteobacteria bacterium]MDA0827228.1 molybdenum cofactor biosynthesis protein B [Pseudomonadota bacterium]MDA7591109.1 molybdenum cofactor biosynthesis protein B [Pseudomonadales bacterium]MBT5463922.1 molybdenum cofactor biosynthesis protein B [Gammaproteobacteria bacterium]MBT7388581.1 molybdenum cofactor biosynthesis protein B [Gammaproteobacteria bacterium]|tara:strand:+ start:86 stop:589 length:504 start_codon:yes stop_codon:yes gene_type:complete